MISCKRYYLHPCSPTRLYLNFMKDDLKITPTFMGIFDSGGLSDNSVFWEVTSMRGS